MRAINFGAINFGAINFGRGGDQMGDQHWEGDQRGDQLRGEGDQLGDQLRWGGKPVQWSRNGKVACRTPLSMYRRKPAIPDGCRRTPVNATAPPAAVYKSPLGRGTGTRERRSACWYKFEVRLWTSNPLPHTTPRPRHIFLFGKMQCRKISNHFSQNKVGEIALFYRALSNAPIRPPICR